jgi:cysteine desulfurase / selenocysteine lyase
MDFQIIDYKPEYQPYFENLNRAWLEEYFTVEDFDKWVLENPEEAIIKTGGKVYFATIGSTIIGTVALRFLGDGVYELTKMAIDKAYNGNGYGQLLCQAGIDKAKELGAKKLVLWSSRVLKNAIHIYNKLGFAEIPVIPGTYGRADIMMEINFDDSQKTEIMPFTEREIQQFRDDTRGTSKKIHFNNAGSSLPPDVVVDTVINYLNEESINGGYETEKKYKTELENTRQLIAKLINADSDEIALVENASIGWIQAFYGVGLKPGDEVITSEMEYVTNVIGFLNVRKMYGIEIKVIPNDKFGAFGMEAFKAAINPKTKLIAITHIPSTAGGMMPIVDIGKTARKHNVLYLVDACQSAGQVPLDVREIGCDMLAVTGRKYLRAPRGTGFLYVRKEIQDRLQCNMLDGHNLDWVSETDFKLKDNAQRFELYERNRALTLGLGKAVEYILNIGIERIWERIQYLAGLMRQQLEEIDGVTVHDFGVEQCGIVTFSVAGMDAENVKNIFFERQINVSVGLAKSTLFYMNKNKLTSVVRASVHYYNTGEEVKIMCQVLTEIRK